MPSVNNPIAGPTGLEPFGTANGVQNALEVRPVMSLAGASYVPAQAGSGTLSSNRNVADLDGGNGELATGSWVSQAGTSGPWTPQRTPNKFFSVLITALGNTAIWTPTATKKFRLMRYSVKLLASSVVAVAGIVTVSFQDAAVATGVGTFDIWVPAAAANTEGIPFTSNWIDLGNGYLSSAANNVLNGNLSVALTAGGIRIDVAGTEE